MMELMKQTAIVTGSTRGIGKETALLLLKNGLNVVISSKSKIMYIMPYKKFMVNFLLKKKIS
jgi:short-subunit dehydrogenase